MIKASKKFDVIVVGGGVAGVAAAVSAGRAGCSVALIEKTVFWGGLATTGNVFAYLAICDGCGVKVTRGIAEELLRISMKYGPGRIHDDWEDPQSSSRLSSLFSPASFILAMDELLKSEGVDLWLDTLACVPVMDGNQVAGVEVENKSGRIMIEASCVIDSSGDADIAARAGAECEVRDNFVSIWALEANRDAMKKAIAGDDEYKMLNLATAGGSDVGDGLPEGYRKYFGTDGREVSEFILDARNLLLEKYKQRQADAGENGRGEIFPLTLPAMADFRTTRRIHGLATLRDGDQWKSFDDSVGLVVDWRGGGGGKEKTVWEVPYGTLIPEKIEGLLAAGRCISATGAAWEDTRVIPAAAHTGEISGLAAAIAIEKNTTPGLVPVAELKGRLRERGIVCTLNELYGDKLPAVLERQKQD